MLAATGTFSYWTKAPGDVVGGILVHCLIVDANGFGVDDVADEVYYDSCVDLGPRK